MKDKTFVTATKTAENMFFVKRLERLLVKPVSSVNTRELELTSTSTQLNNE